MGKKMLNDEDYNNYWEDVAKKLDNRIQDLFAGTISDYAMNALYRLGECESPIEQIFLITMMGQEFECCGYADGPFYVEEQKAIGNYKVDFAIETRFKGKEFKIAIECDGHDFHEKTKAQALRDKQRDRYLIKEGYTVMHFTGSEIYANPYKCVCEVLQIIFPEIFSAEKL
jgi:very-short-patch-repair endonuclease